MLKFAFTIICEVRIFTNKNSSFYLYDNNNNDDDYNSTGKTEWQIQQKNNEII